MLKWKRGRSAGSGSVDDSQACGGSSDRISEEPAAADSTDPDTSTKRTRKPSAATVLRSSLSCPDINDAVSAQLNGVQAVEIDIGDPKGQQRDISDNTGDTDDNRSEDDAGATLSRQQRQSTSSRASWMQVIESGDTVADNAELEATIEAEADQGTAEANSSALLPDVLDEFLTEQCIPPNLPSDLKEYISRVDPNYSTDTKATDFRLESAKYECLEKEIHYAYLVRMARAFLMDRLLGEARLSPEQVERVFPRRCLDNLVRIHCPVARALRVGFLESISAASKMHIGDYSQLLLEHFRTNEQKIIETYGRLTANQESAQAEYKSWISDKKQGDRAATLSALRSQPACERQGVNELLLLFTQRLTKYPALFEAIIKQSEKLSQKLAPADKQRLEAQVSRWKQLLELSEGILKKVDQLKPEFENETKLALLRTRMEPRLVALYDRPTAATLDEQIKQRLQSLPSVVAIQSGADISAPLISTIPANLLHYCGQFGREQLDGDSRKLLHMEIVRLRNQRGKFGECTIVVLSDFVLFLQDDGARATYFSQDGKACCIPVVYTVSRENATAREQNGILIVVRYPNRNSEMYELLCSSSHDRTKLLDALKNAVLNCPEMPIIDENEEAERLIENFNKLFDMISKLYEKDTIIQKAVSEKMALFNSIFEVIHAQLGTNYAEDLKLSKLESTADATQLAACVDAAGKLHGLLRNSCVLATVQSSPTGSVLSSQSFIGQGSLNRTHRPSAFGDSQNPALADDNFVADPQDVQAATRALQTLCQLLPKAIETATRQRTELESVRIRLLQANILGDNDVTNASRNSNRDDDRGMMQINSRTSNVSVQRNPTQNFTPSKQLAELRAKQEELQNAKREWEKQRLKEQKMLDSQEEFYKKERAEMEKERAELGRQFEKLKSEREMFQTQVDLLTSANPQLADATVAAGLTSTPSRASLTESSAAKISPHGSVHHQRTSSSQSNEAFQAAGDSSQATSTPAVQPQTGLTSMQSTSGITPVAQGAPSGSSLSRMTSMPPGMMPIARNPVLHTTSVRVPPALGGGSKANNMLTPGLLALSDSSKKDAKRGTAKPEPAETSAAVSPVPYMQYSVQPPVMGTAPPKQKRGVLDLGGLGPSQPAAALSSSGPQLPPRPGVQMQQGPGFGLVPPPKPALKPVAGKPNTKPQDEIFF